jgi:hypothetical protein
MDLGRPTRGGAPRYQPLGVRPHQTRWELGRHLRLQKATSLGELKETRSEGATQKRACGVCGQLGHRADIKTYHPKHTAPAHAPSPLPQPPLLQAPLLSAMVFPPPPQPSPSPPGAPPPLCAHASAAAARAAAAPRIGSIVVKLGAMAITMLLGPGGQFGLDDVVRSGGVPAAAPPAAAAVGGGEEEEEDESDLHKTSAALPPPRAFTGLLLPSCSTSVMEEGCARSSKIRGNETRMRFMTSQVVDWPPRRGGLRRDGSL